MGVLDLKVVANHDEVAARHGAEGGEAGARRAEHTMSAGYRNDAINGGGKITWMMMAMQ